MSIVLVYHDKKRAVACCDDRSCIVDKGELRQLPGRFSKITTLPDGSIIGTVGRHFTGERLRAMAAELDFAEALDFIRPAAQREFAARDPLTTKFDKLDVLLVGFDRSENRIRCFVWRSADNFAPLETTSDPRARIACLGAFHSLDEQSLDKLTLRLGRSQCALPFFAASLRDSLNRLALKNPTTIGLASFFAAVDRHGSFALPDEFAPPPAMPAAIVETAVATADLFYIGSIRTPAQGAPPTIGNDDGGAGAQVGNITTLAMGVHITNWTPKVAGTPMPAGTIVNIENMYDLNLTTYGTILLNASSGQDVSVGFTGSPGFVQRNFSATLSITYGVPVNSLNGNPVYTAVNIEAFRALDINGNFVDLIGVVERCIPGQTRPVHTVTFALPSDLNFAQFAGYFQLDAGDSTGGVVQVDIFDIRVQLVS